MTLKRPKSKGNRFEAQVVDQLRGAGWPDAHRNWMSGGMGGADIINGPADLSIECKKQERIQIWACLHQAEAAARVTDTPCLVFTRNRERVWAAVPFDFLVELLQEREDREAEAA